MEFDQIVSGREAKQKIVQEVQHLQKEKKPAGYQPSTVRFEHHEQKLEKYDSLTRLQNTLRNHEKVKYDYYHM